MTKDEALKLALEALENAEYGDYDKKELNKAITAIREALAQPEHEEIEQVMLEVWQDVGDPRFPHIAQPEQEPWPNEPAGHMAGGVQPSKMTKSKAITAIYALFNAPHNADINLTGLNKVLDELMAQPEQEPVATVAEVHMSRYTIEWTNGPLPEGTKLYTTPPQRTWVGLTDEEIWETPTLSKFARAIEAKLRSKNT